MVELDEADIVDGTFRYRSGREDVMAHDVFISYSSKDKAIADSICAALEQRRIRCWIAPRDIVPGVLYGEAIVDALSGSRLLVLVFSSHSNVSPQVAREVERAASKGLTIIPFRVEEAPMSKPMEYFISSPHWLDALTPPLEKHLCHLAETVSLLLSRMTDAPTGAVSDGRMECDATTSGGPATSRTAHTTEPASVGAIYMVAEQVTQHYCAEYADIRFTISNLSDRPQKVPMLELRIVSRCETETVRMKKAGAMLQEFRLSACIDEREAQDLFADVESQEVLEPHASDAFRLRLEGSEGMRYTCIIAARFESLASGETCEVASKPFAVEYPIRSIEVLRLRKAR